MSPASARLQFRIRPDRSRIIRECESTTRVPAEFFDDLLAALDAPSRRNAALARAAKRARDTVTFG